MLLAGAIPVRKILALLSVYISSQLNKFSSSRPEIENSFESADQKFVSKEKLNVLAHGISSGMELVILGVTEFVNNLAT